MTSEAKFALGVLTICSALVLWASCAGSKASEYRAKRCAHRGGVYAYTDNQSNRGLCLDPMALR